MSDIAAHPGETDRDAIDRLLDAGDAYGARLAARRYWASSPNASAARFLKARYGRLWPEPAAEPFRLAVLRSFTLEPVLPLLEAEALLAGRRLETWIGEFNAYGQEILDPASGLYAHRPDAVILAVQTRDIAPSLWREFDMMEEAEARAAADEAARLLIDLLEALRARTPATLVVHGLEKPLHPSEGLLGVRKTLSQDEAIETANHQVRRWCADQAGVVFLDYDRLQARHGRAAFLSETKWAAARLPLSAPALGWLAAAWWRHLAPVALPPAKVLVLDLDNTLWGGVLGEDGPDGVRLGDEPPGVFFKAFQRAVLEVSRRGVLLAVASKNNPDEALAMIDQHPHMLIRSRHLAAVQIGWKTKAEGLIAMAGELNLGLDSFIFVDDSPFECEGVARALPQVEVLALPSDPADYVAALNGVSRLERHALTEEDGARSRYYADDRQRRDLQAQATSLEAFLASLAIEVEAAPVDAATLARAAQLTQKTNQLNTTTRRYSEAELAAHLQRPDAIALSLRAADRFGDNGIVGLAVATLAGAACEIDVLLLSCRVIGRRIETALLAALAQAARARGAETLRGWYRPTARNAPARDIFRDAGFDLAETAPEGDLWGFPLKRAIQVPEWIVLRNLATADS